MGKCNQKNPEVAKRAESTRRAPQRCFRHLHAEIATEEANVRKCTLGTLDRTSTSTTAAQASDLLKDVSFCVSRLRA